MSSGVTHGWRISDVDSFQYWRGNVRTETNFYAWSAGEPTSGFRHYRQGKFENCILDQGCFKVTYPTNTLRGHSNGTWSWSTSG